MVNRAEIGRFDGELKRVVFNEGDTVESLLNKADLSLGSGEQLKNDNDKDVSLSEKAEDDAVYYIVGNYKQG